MLVLLLQLGFFKTQDETLKPYTPTNVTAETHWLPHFAPGTTAKTTFFFSSFLTTFAEKTIVGRRETSRLGKPRNNRQDFVSCLRRAQDVGAFSCWRAALHQTQMSGADAAQRQRCSAPPSAPRCGRWTRRFLLCPPSSQVLCWK